MTTISLSDLISNTLADPSDARKSFAESIYHQNPLDFRPPKVGVVLPPLGNRTLRPDLPADRRFPRADRREAQCSARLTLTLSKLNRPFERDSGNTLRQRGGLRFVRYPVLQRCTASFSTSEGRTSSCSPLCILLVSWQFLHRCIPMGGIRSSLNCIHGADTEFHSEQRVM
jgi:hypothetical protein